jgi:acyl-CoA synthetase (NDP forming)
VAVIGQSGGMGFAFFDRGRPKEIPFSYVITTGNEACLEVFDVVDHLLDEGRTEVFLLFLENIKNADTFKRVAEKALRAGKPIIVTKIGHSDAGQRAAASHTAALAGSYETYQAMFRHYGIIEGSGIEEMVDLAGAFSCYRNKLPAGTRVGIGTASGGGGGWMADACVAAGLQIPTLDDATRKLIDPYLPAYGTSQNPVDGTAQAIREIGYSELARLIATSEHIDSVIMVTSARSAEIFERDHRKLKSLSRDGHKPVLMWTYTLPSPDSTRIISETGFHLFTDMRHCARAAVELARYRAHRERFVRNTAAAQFDVQRISRIRAALNASTLCEYQITPLLREYGITPMDAELATSADDAVRIAADLQAPVALKVQSPDIPHKTEAGAVALNLRDADAIRDGYAQLLLNCKTYAPQARIDGVLVQRMAAKGIECIVGIRRDQLFGPMIMVGLGGIHVEILRDVALAPTPLTRDDAQEMLSRLRGRALLDGVRGGKPADVSALIDLIVCLSRFASENADMIDDLELNPVLVHDQGNGVSIVDALLNTRYSPTT